MIDAVLDLLACPHCGSPLAFVFRERSRLYCHAGHCFDLARQGYVSLLGGAGTRFKGDDAAMVADRERFLAAGHFAAFEEAVSAAASAALAELGMPRTADLDPADLLADPVEPAVCEVGAGTGRYLRAVLDHARAEHHVLARGLGLDVSVPAARRLARADERIGAVVADAWSPWPVRDGVMDVVMAVFAPRNIGEFARVLTPGGSVVILTPEADHLGELVSALGLVGVDRNKDERLAEMLGRAFRPAGDARRVRATIRLDHAGVVDLVGMGPSARHVDAEELRRRVARLPETVDVTIAATVGRHIRN